MSSAVVVHAVRTSDGRQIMAEYAPSEGLPIVLLHGLSQQRHFWRPVIGFLHAPVVAIDQRGHGDSDTPLDADYSIDRCASDVVEVLDDLGIERAVLIGHSWGAWVAARAAAAHPQRIAGTGLIDGALRSPADLGTRAEALQRLRPPVLGIPADELWSRISSGDLGPYLDAAIKAALLPTFVDEGGLLRTRIGIDRHMAVLEGILDYDATEDIRARSVDTYAVIAGTHADLDDRVLARLDRIGPHMHLQAWAGAIHDVPLQWPALVGGWIASVHASVSRMTDERREA